MSIFNVILNIVMVLISIPLYIIAVIIVFIALFIRLNAKNIFKLFPQTPNTLNDKHKNTYTRSYKGWPFQYLKYVVNNYFKIVWGGKFSIKELSRFTKSKYKTTDDNNPNSVSNLPYIPINKELPDTSNKPHHADNLSRVSTKCKQNHLMMK